MTLYIRREIAKEGLPSKAELWYYTNAGNVLFDGEDFYRSGIRMNPITDDVKWWLEPVEWPTEGQINAWIEDHDFIGLERTAAEGMATWLLSRLTKA